MTLNNSSIDSPTRYKASESPAFAGRFWRTYSGTSTFTLSSGSGTKTVYLKVKNSVGESLVVSNTIELQAHLNERRR